MFRPTERPWLASYPPAAPHDITAEHDSALEMFRSTAARHGSSPAIDYFGGGLTWSELESDSDALAVAFAGFGVGRGDRVAVYLQNVPQYVVVMLASWKVGAVVVAVNPMNRERELDYVLRDSAAVLLVCHEHLYDAVGRSVLDGSSVRSVLTTSELDHLRHRDDRLFAGIERQRHDGTADLAETIASSRGQRPEPVALARDDVAILTYTSGTTGEPKGAMNTHGNVTFNAQVLRDWIGIGSDDVILGVAPLFHITGLIAHVALSLLTGAPLVLAYRFDPGVIADVIRERRPTFTIGSITVFIALMNVESLDRDSFASLAKIYSGGAPIAPATAAAFRDRFGVPIHNIYGLTETTSPSHAVPFGADAPVDPTSGALSVGLPVFNTIVRVVDDDGNEVPVGEIGELVTEGPQVVAGYWGKPDETARSIPGGRLHTGDVGFMDADGWFYIVDRKKDMIIAAGYKVWPREVEDVLYGHPAVREVAVVGIPDDYRGETVKAVVSLRPGHEVATDEIIAFAKERMAAYKYPRVVEIVDELPKTVTGKILRREVRG